MGSGKFILHCLGSFRPKPYQAVVMAVTHKEKKKLWLHLGLWGGISEGEELTGQRERQVSESGKGLCSARLEKRKEASVV